MDQTENFLQEMDLLYSATVRKCCRLLADSRSVDMRDYRLIVRATVTAPDAEWTVEELAVDLWVDRVEYVDNSSFNLYVTRAEENVCWNIRKKGQVPGRLDEPQQRITVYADLTHGPLVVALPYLIVLNGKLTALASSDPRMKVGLTQYNDENMMAAVMQRLDAMIEPDGAPREDPEACLRTIC